jgi:hypothetical protein
MKSILIIGLILLTLGPAWGAGIQVVGELTRELTLQPGDRVQGKILVQNRTEDTQQVNIFQTDYQFFANGVNNYGKAGNIVRSNATWITFAPRLLTLPKNETLAIDYVIQVPKEGRLTGTYWSVLMVEPIPAAKLDPKPRKNGTVGINTVLRYAIQMVTQIGQTGERAMKFTGKQLLQENGKKILLIDAENTGERWLRPQIWAQIFNQDGTDCGRFSGQRLRIYPGCSARFQVDLSSLSKGNYSALVVGDNGDEYVFGARYEFSLN